MASAEAMRLERDVLSAKRELLAFGAAADAEVQRTLEQARSQAKKLAPWAAGLGAAALVLGAIGGRGSGGLTGAAQRGVGLATALVGIARVAMPIVRDVLAKGR